ncbi:MAG: hemerythrin family protein [Gallionella sp.]|nr:hemerythrin family protein [Gallionella sp.]
MTTPWQLDWNESLSMFIPEIDAQHQNFIRLINELNEAIIGRMDIEEIKRRMQSILDDAAMHFAHEEVLFKEWGYPGAEEHAQRHVQAMQFFRKIMEEFGRDRTEYEWIEAGLKVKQALIGHLLAEDIKYRDYRVAQGQLSRPMP